MTTFQAILYGILHGFSEILPVGGNTHQVLAGYLLNWPIPMGPMAGALALGSLLSILVYFIHDWLSMISTFLQVIIYRKRPMTLDERLPIFLTITSIPILLGWFYLHDKIAEMEWTAPVLACLLAASTLPLWATDSYSRKTKGMFDWNWLDALVVGLMQMLMLVPGFGRSAAVLPGAMTRNYNREAAVKYSLYAAAPILAGKAYLHLHGISLHQHSPMDDLSWMSFFIALVVTFFTSLLAIGGFMKGVHRRGFGQYGAYRLIVAAAVGAVWFLRTRNG